MIPAPEGAAGLRPVVVDLWAPWCAPCRAVAPALDRLAAEYAGRVALVKINVDEAPGAARALGVRGIPTMLALRDGREVGRVVGVRPDAALRALFDAAAGSAPAGSAPAGALDGSTRALRLAAAIALLGVAAVSGWPLPLVVAAAAAAAAAVYDRCPLLAALTARRPRRAPPPPTPQGPSNRRVAGPS